MRFVLILTTAVLFLFTKGDIYGQERFSAEFRPGVSFPLNEMAGTNVNTGYGFELTVAYEVLQDVGIYAGWGWNKFDAENAFVTNRVDIEETGYTAGIQFKHRIKNSSLSYLVRGGAVYNHLEMEGSDGEFIAGSDHGIGWQAEAGITFEIGNNWDLRPTVRYRSLPGDIDVFNGQMSVDLQYISFGVGLAKKF
jgi:opacity protein-like surface antigen